MGTKPIETLAADAKSGKPGAMLELWEAVRRYVEVRAKDSAKRNGYKVPLDDLRQAGFLAVADAAENYDPARENSSYWRMLDFAIKNRFAAEYGIKTTKRDALLYSESLDAEAREDEADSPSIIDSVADEGAALAFMGVEYADFLTYCRGVIAAALDSLPPEQAAAVRLRYLDGLSLEMTRRILRKSDIRVISETISRAFQRLRRGSKHTRPLRECLEAFEDFQDYMSAGHNTGLGSFKRSGVSSTEAAALIGKRT